jgi:DNA-binding SARP family transcriptional activator
MSTPAKPLRLRHAATAAPVAADAGIDPYVVDVTAAERFAVMQLCAAALAFAAGHDAEGRARLRHALAVLEPAHGTALTTLDEHTRAGLAGQAIVLGYTPARACALLRVAAAAAPATSEGAAAPATRLEIRTFGRFGVVRDGRTLPLSRRQMALLCAILVYGGRKVSISRLLDALWPEADGDRARGAFHVALHRLRQRIGSDVLEVQSSHVTLNNARCWVDLWEFEHYLNRLLHLRTARSPRELLPCFARARALFREPILSTCIDEPWVLLRARRLRQLYLLAIGDLAQALSAAGAIADAIECYRAACELEPKNELFINGAQRCAHLLGHDSGAHTEPHPASPAP